MSNVAGRRSFWIIPGLLLVTVTALAATHAVADKGSDDRAPASPRVVLLEHGAKPHRTLRFEPKVGSEQIVEMITTVTSEDTLDGQAIPSQPQPGMRLVMHVTIKPPPAADRILAELVCERIELVNSEDFPDGQRTAIAQSFAQMRGVKFLMKLTPRGEILANRIETPPGFPEHLNAALATIEDGAGQMFSPWPVEAVGPGAKWRVEQVVAGKAIEIRQTGTYELIAREGSIVTLRARIEQTADPQQISDSTRLVSMKTGGAADFTYDLTRILPVRSTVKVAGMMDYQIGEGDAARRLRSKLDTSVRVGEPDASAPAESGEGA
jgi:hypothetical protein